jgi:hypothetical protein
VDTAQDRLFYGRQVQAAGEDDIAVDDQVRWADHDGEQVRDIDHPRLRGDDPGHLGQHGRLDAAPGQKVPVGSQQEHRGGQKDRYAQVISEAGQVPSGDTATDERTAIGLLKARTPLGVPWIEPADVAPLVVFLASDQARMVSGTSFAVTGGDSAHLTA